MSEAAANRPGSYVSRRSVVHAPQGLVATSQPLAAQAGLHAMREGGDAFDAAVTASAVLSVVEPMMSGPGGDLFALYRTADGAVEGLASGGPAPQTAEREVVCRALDGDGGEDEVPSMPGRGPLTVTVPGCVKGWQKLLEVGGGSARWGPRFVPPYGTRATDSRSRRSSPSTGSFSGSCWPRERPGRTSCPADPPRAPVSGSDFPHWVEHWKKSPGRGRMSSTGARSPEPSSRRCNPGGVSSHGRTFHPSNRAGRIPSRPGTGNEACSSFQPPTRGRWPWRPSTWRGNWGFTGPSPVRSNGPIVLLRP